MIVNRVLTTRVVRTTVSPVNGLLQYGEGPHIRAGTVPNIGRTRTVQAWYAVVSLNSIVSPAEIRKFSNGTRFQFAMSRASHQSTGTGDCGNFGGMAVTAVQGQGTLQRAIGTSNTWASHRPIVLNVGCFNASNASRSNGQITFNYILTIGSFRQSGTIKIKVLLGNDCVTTTPPRSTCTRTCPAGYRLDTATCTCVCARSCQPGYTLNRDTCTCVRTTQAPRASASVHIGTDKNRVANRERYKITWSSTRYTWVRVEELDPGATRYRTIGTTRSGSINRVKTNPGTYRYRITGSYSATNRARSRDTVNVNVAAKVLKCSDFSLSTYGHCRRTTQCGSGPARRCSDFTALRGATWSCTLGKVACIAQKRLNWRGGVVTLREYQYAKDNCFDCQGRRRGTGGGGTTQTCTLTCGPNQRLDRTRCVCIDNPRPLTLAPISRITLNQGEVQTLRLPVAWGGTAPYTYSVPQSQSSNGWTSNTNTSTRTTVITAANDGHTSERRGTFVWTVRDAAGNTQTTSFPVIVLAARVSTPPPRTPLTLAKPSDIIRVSEAAAGSWVTRPTAQGSNANINYELINAPDLYTELRSEGNRHIIFSQTNIVGTHVVTLRATEDVAQNARSVSQTFRVIIRPKPAPPPGPAALELPEQNIIRHEHDATQRRYSATRTRSAINGATGGEPPYRYELINNSLLSSGASAWVDGTDIIVDTQEGIASFGGRYERTLQVTDRRGQKRTRPVVIIITETGTPPAPPELVLPRQPHIRYTKDGSGLTQEITPASGGTEPYLYRLFSAPTGVSLIGTTIHLRDTGLFPVPIGTFTATLEARDSSRFRQRKTRSVAITVTAPAPPLVLPDQTDIDYTKGTNGTSSNIVGATGGSTPYRYSLPQQRSGISISTTGTPRILVTDDAAEGLQEVTLRVTDAANNTAEKTVSIRVRPEVVVCGPMRWKDFPTRWVTTTCRESRMRRANTTTTVEAETGTIQGPKVVPCDDTRNITYSVGTGSTVCTPYTAVSSSRAVAITAAGTNGVGNTDYTFEYARLARGESRDYIIIAVMKDDPSSRAICA